MKSGRMGHEEATMKHVETLVGSVVVALEELGLDPAKVLTALNSWRGSQKADASKGTLKTSAKLSGRVLKSGEDKRAIRLTDAEKSVAVCTYSGAGALLALSDSLRELETRHGVTVDKIILPAEVLGWVVRDSFRFDAPEGTPEA